MSNIKTSKIPGHSCQESINAKNRMKSARNQLLTGVGTGHHAGSNKILGKKLRIIKK